MNISYWNCKYSDCDSYSDPEEGTVWLYGCTHPNNQDNYCALSNKWNCSKDDCTLLDTEIST